MGWRRRLVRAGDRIAKWEGDIVYTFADLQHRYDKVPRSAKTVTVTVERDGGTKDHGGFAGALVVDKDTRYRQSSVEPRSYFEDRALTAEEKAKLGLPADGFASYVKYVSSMAQSVQSHDLKVGDIIVAVDGKERDENADTASLYIVLHKTPGDTGTLEVLRDGKKNFHAAEDHSDEFSEMKLLVSIVVASIALAAAVGRSQRRL